MTHTDVVATLAKLGHFADKKITVIASVCLMTGAAVLGHGWMLKGIRTFLFRMTRVAEIRDRIRIKHVFAETSMRRVAVGAFDFPLSHGVVGLPGELTSLLLMAGDTHSRLGVF